MYRAIHRYKSDNPNTLSFEKNDRFTISKDDNSDKDWLLVENENCFTGYVPANFLEKDKTQNGEAILYLERGIAGLKEQIHRDNTVAPDKDNSEMIKKLESHKEALITNKATSVRRPRPPAPPVRTVSKEKAPKPKPTESVSSSHQGHSTFKSDLITTTTAAADDSVKTQSKRVPTPAGSSVQKSDSSGTSAVRTAAPPPPTAPAPKSPVKVAAPPSPCSQYNGNVKRGSMKSTSSVAQDTHLPDHQTVEYVEPLAGYMNMNEARRRNTAVESDYDIPSRLATSQPLVRASSDNTGGATPSRCSSEDAVDSTATSPGFKVYAREPSQRQPRREAPSPPVPVTQAYNRRNCDSTDKPELPIRKNSKHPSDRRDSRPQQVVPAPPPPTQDKPVHCKDRSLPPIPMEHSSSSLVSTDSTVGGGVSTLRSPYPRVAGSMVKNLEQRLKLDHRSACEAVSVVLETLMDTAASEVSRVVKKILTDLKEISSGDGNNEDVLKLTSLLTKLTQCKDDSQQRSWHLYDDEGTINEMLSQLLNLLSVADNKTEFTKVLENNDFAYVQNLITYYQMETRVKLKLLLLKIFGVVAGYGTAFISILLNSVLPLELAMHIINEDTSVKMLCFSALVLTMIFSMGETLPNSHLTYLNENFSTHLLQQVEKFATDNDRVADVSLSAVLAFNLSFQRDSPVIKAINKSKCKYFTEKLLLLMNRGDDPVCLFPDLEPRPQHSIMKIISDLYESCKPGETSIFYVNDERVLIDIIIRQLTDLSPGDQMRTEHLSLILMMIRRSDYLQHRYRDNDLSQVLTSIYKSDGQSDLEIVRYDRELAAMVQRDLVNC